MPRITDRRIPAGGVGPIAATPASFAAPTGTATQASAPPFRHTGSPIYPTFNPGAPSPQPSPMGFAMPAHHGHGHAHNSHGSNHTLSHGHNHGHGHSQSSPRPGPAQVYYGHPQQVGYAPWQYQYPAPAQQGQHHGHAQHHAHPQHHQQQQQHHQPQHHHLPQQHHMPPHHHQQHQQHHSQHPQHPQHPQHHLAHSYYPGPHQPVQVPMPGPIHSGAAHLAGHGGPVNGGHGPYGHYPAHFHPGHGPADHYAGGPPSRFSSPAVGPPGPMFVPPSKMIGQASQFGPTSSMPSPSVSVVSQPAPIGQPIRSKTLATPWFSGTRFSVRPIRSSAPPVELAPGVRLPVQMSSFLMKTAVRAAPNAAIKAAVKAAPFTPAVMPPELLEMEQQAAIEREQLREKLRTQQDARTAPAKPAPEPQPVKKTEPTAAEPAPKKTPAVAQKVAQSVVVALPAISTAPPKPASPSSSSKPKTPVSSSAVAPASRTTSPPSAAPAVVAVPAVAVSARSVRSGTITSEAGSTGAKATSTEVVPVQSTVAEPTATPAAAPRVVAKSWADLVKSKSPAKPVSNGTAAPEAAPPVTRQAGSLADVMQSFRTNSQPVHSFIVPRGLVNTGNMCYMNSVLQALLFTPPFYRFLEAVRTQTRLRLRSETPLVDTMVDFINKFTVTESAPTRVGLRSKLGPSEYDNTGKSFVPSELYDTLRQLTRFSSMERGHQQDAEEFLGFLLDGMSDECAHAIKTAHVESSSSPTGQSDSGEDNTWLEVGRKQKMVTTRTVTPGPTTTPISDIFAGQVRSELRVAGLKPSVTVEPFQPLQLDIQGSHINTLSDALIAFSQPETLVGDWGGPRNARTATKQVFLDQTPDVMIIHLKRFYFDRAPSPGDGARKIWKRIRYPLELELPAETLSPSRRQAGAKYQLLSVIYHHGTTATSGHYTVDVRRQDGNSWIRFDDTVVERVTADDVLGTALDKKAKKSPRMRSPRLATSPHSSDGQRSPKTASSGGWHDEGAADRGDGKVAYILFYERIQ